MARLNGIAVQAYSVVVVVLFPIVEPTVNRICCMWVGWAKRQLHCERTSETLAASSPHSHPQTLNVLEVQIRILGPATICTRPAHARSEAGILATAART
jgi:hypothetical protein